MFEKHRQFIEFFDFLFVRRRHAPSPFRIEDDMAFRACERAAAGVVHADAMVAQNLHQPPAFDRLQFMDDAVAILNVKGRQRLLRRLGRPLRRQVLDVAHVVDASSGPLRRAVADVLYFERINL
jgi:hypothetical protein